uniref:Protein kinase domain-containing protein n=1 Tax=Strongyloides papillosus TaxID=174720 RepID=A0A0N5B504_STREA
MDFFENGSSYKRARIGSVNGTEQVKDNITSVRPKEKKLFLFKIPQTNYSDENGFLHATKLEFSYNGGNVTNVRIPNGPSNSFQLDKFVEKIQCDFRYCKIGAFYYKINSSEEFDLGNPPKYDGIFFVAYEATEKYRFLVLMYLNKKFDKNYLNVVVCPHEAWISKHSLSEYIVDKNDIIPFANKDDNDEFYYYYKMIHYQDSGSEIFLKCGHINQLFIPKIDVGYVWESNEKDKLYFNTNALMFNFSNTALTFDLNSGLSHYVHGSLLNSSLIVYHVLSPDYNFNSNSTIIGRYNNDSKLYSGQRIFVLHKNEYKELKYKISNERLGRTYNIYPQFRVPNIKATLRLKVNDKVQEFKTTNNSESMDTYTVNLREIKNGLVGCHAVPDDMNDSIFGYFYEKRYKTDLFIFDKNENKYTKVNDLKSLISNSIYKCVLNKETTDLTELRASDIKENHFIIHLIGSMNSDKSNDLTKSNSTKWIFIGVPIGVFLVGTLLLLVGLIIYKKRQLRKKESKNYLSSRKSSSASKSSSVIKNNSNVSRIQNKSVSAGSKKMEKKRITLTTNPSTSHKNEKR